MGVLLGSARATSLNFFVIAVRVAPQPDTYDCT